MTPPPHPTSARLPTSVVRWLFPVALLLFGGFFFAGHLGWWSDDYWHCLRDPITGDPRSWVMNRGFFLRPLFYIVVPAITTAFWNHDWIAHAIQVALHGAVVLLLWRWLMMLGLRRAIAGAAALLFIVYPAQFEALFWVAALPTVLSTALMLIVLMMATRWRGMAGPGSLVSLAAIFALTFAAACLNEQPVSVVAAMPILAWIVWRRQDSPRRPARAIPALLPTVASGLAAAAYIILRITDSRAPAGARGSAETLIAASKLTERTLYFCDVLWRRLVMKNWAPGALREGWDQLTSTWWGWPALLMTAAFGIVWAISRSPSQMVRTERDPTHAAHPRVLTLLGVAIFLAGWLPILIMAAYEPDSRCRYWPNIGLALLFAAAIQAASRTRAVQFATPARLLLAAILLLWSIMLIGAQSGFRTRWQLDQSESAELRRLIPNPAPYTFFIPLNIEERALETRAPVLDTHFRSVWEFPWTTRSWLERTYKREDVFCGYWRHWTPGIPVKGADEAGIHYADTLGPRFPELPDGTRLIPWDRAVVFTIGKDHVLRVVTSLVIPLEHGGEQVIELPQARGLPAMSLRLNPP